jgi:tetratricopeptide (TPR) repeat protein
LWLLCGGAWYPPPVDRVDGELLTPAMLRRDVVAGLDAARASRDLREELDVLATLRGQPPGEALVWSLDRVIFALAELEWPDLALLVYREQLAAYRAMEAAEPGAYTDALGRTLSGLRDTLVELRRYEEALPVAREEMRVWSELADTLSVSAARYWLTVALGELGRSGEALESAAEAVTELEARVAGGAGGPVRYYLAKARSEYARRLAHAGRFEDAVEVAALVAAEVAAEVAEEVADVWDRPDPVRRVEALQALARALARVGRYDDARATFDEALRLMRQPAADGAFGPAELAIVYGNHSRFLSDLGLIPAAVAASEQAVAAARANIAECREGRDRLESDFAEPDLRAARLRLCEILSDMGGHLEELGRMEEARAAYTEAVTIARENREADPAESEPRLAIVLNNIAVHLDLTGDHEAARDTADEAVALYAGLVAADPEAYAPWQALARHTRGVILSNLGRHDEALAESAEVVATYRRLHGTDPYGVAADLAAALVDHARIRSRRGERAEAVAAAEEAVRLIAPLAERDPGRHAAGHARALAVAAEVR